MNDLILKDPDNEFFFEYVAVFEVTIQNIKGRTKIVQGKGFEPSDH